MSYKKIISLDLDGVLNNYAGDYNEEIIPEIKEGAREFLQKLSGRFNLEIFTTRDIELTKKWVKDNNLSDYISDVRNIKNPFTSIFINDRALNFNGDFNLIYNQIISFKPYWKDIKQKMWVLNHAQIF